MVSTTVKQHQCKGWQVFLLALVLVTLLFILQGNIGLDLADEGYLWYGTVQTAAGDIPMRDFRSYDPGRYYWAAMWSLVFGQGIMALRLSIALFQVIGLTLGLLAAKRVVKNWLGLSLVGVLLLVWMYLRYKSFEHSLAMAAVYVAVCLIEKPVSIRYFFSGVFVGLAAFMGRNHGLYSLCAFLLLILFIRLKLKRKGLPKQLGLWLVGIVLGYAPMITLLALPNMFELYLFDKVLIFFSRDAANLTLPVPWPWTINYVKLSFFSGMSQFFAGLLFLLLPIFYTITTLRLLSIKPSSVPGQSLLVASAVIGPFYMHHAFSRADLAHLAESMHPFLLGWIALFSTLLTSHPRKKLAIGLVGLVLAGSVIAIAPTISFMRKLRAPQDFVSYTVTGDQIWLQKKQAAYIDTVQQLVTQHVDPEEGLFIAPHTPGLYPLLQRRSPVHNTYLLFPETREKQEEMIKDMVNNRVNWAIIKDSALDKREDRRFRNTHPLVWQYLMTEFEPVEAPALPRKQQLLHRKDPL